MPFKKRKNKLSMTHDEEFQIFKLVIDKFLWIGAIGIIAGIYMILNQSQDLGLGVLILLVGMTMLLMFTSVMLRHFEFKKTK